MNEKGFIHIIILNVVILAILLGAVFFSQQAYFAPYGRTVYVKGVGQFNVYWVKLNYWANINVYPKISGEVEEGQAVVTQEITKQKNSLAQSAWESIKNYLAQKFSKLSGTEVK
ncbi:MAG: hypothetical protein EXS52_01715 [Candidatus Staskawiczbacteria bacterium]|nr:hypothetical protein [Candidatus Staskawiczbacteria bacterium]